MLIPIIKESERQLEEKLPELIHNLVWEASDGGYNLPANQITSYQGEENRSYTDVKDFIHSSQLALLEGQKEQLEPGGDIIDLEYELRPNGLKKFISSLEESITYLKSKI